MSPLVGTVLERGDLGEQYRNTSLMGNSKCPVLFLLSQSTGLLSGVFFPLLTFLKQMFRVIFSSPRGCNRVKA